MPNAGQGVPLSTEQKQQAQDIDRRIRDFEKKLESKSNTELKEIATQLETVEREMLLEKIDQSLQVVKETIVKPGDAAANAAAAGAASVIISESSTVP